ncbi:MAG: 3'(2'),5'-bisphosphate nucleotidase CysQ [Hyphomonas sp.]
MRAAERTLLEDMDTLRALAREAGDLAVSFQRGGVENRTWNKTGGSPVTEADLEVNRLCAMRLQAVRPEYGWLSEETTDSLDARRKQRCWVVDPIDGTRAFMRDDPHWCVALALIEEGRAVAGVLYAPRQGRFYEAWTEGGAFLNGQAIHVSGCAAEAGCRLITNEGLVEHPSWPEPWPHVTVAKPKPNSTLLRMALVATGEWDATLTLAAKSDWDLAAGTVLVEQAGGVVTTHKGSTAMCRPSAV